MFLLIWPFQILMQHKFPGFPCSIPNFHFIEKFQPSEWKLGSIPLNMLKKMGNRSTSIHLLAWNITKWMKFCSAKSVD